MEILPNSPLDRHFWPRTMSFRPSRKSSSINLRCLMRVAAATALPRRRRMLMGLHRPEIQHDAGKGCSRDAFLGWKRMIMMIMIF